MASDLFGQTSGSFEVMYEDEVCFFAVQIGYDKITWISIEILIINGDFDCLHGGFGADADAWFD